ncbi:protein ST7 homolog [Bicyclus anynana]|uniref:Protein ST7 homolog n=1 Tax=Bicyclus anynana TaxID=110368 RepID=A0ABM3LN87_BICAN|nr:protein ST7 homolog [Bicyclus anynana]
MWDSSTFLGALTPKFYVALTGTSSLISGLILIFEWWYFRKYGTSFIEQVSLTHLGPWLSGAGATSPEPEGGECKVWRNPMSLLRGAEYGRLWSAARRAPLTYYDMNLSAQEHQAWFGAGAGATGADEALARAWREREPAARVAMARAALALRPDCAAALLLLAEEEAGTVLEAERVLRRAWRLGEAAARALAAAGAAGAARREAAVVAHVKRRAAMCARRLGRLRDAARLFRELARDAHPALAALQLHENLLEVLLEQRAFADAHALLARLDDTPAPRSAATAYGTALLRARGASGPAAEAAALQALRRAIAFNPHVPEYLLELRPLTLPPEHVLRRGDSEAVAYAFWHLRHWRAADGALRLLAAAWAAAERAEARAGAAGYRGTACAQCADRELLPAHHALSVFPRRAAPALLPLAAALCAATALLALLAHRWPAAAAAAAARAAHFLDPRRLLPLLAAI